MKNISSGKTNKLLILFVIKAVLSTIISIVLFSLVSSKIILAFDISVDSAKIFSPAICVLTAAVVSFISVKGFKNNGALLGVICQLPLIFYSLINTIFNNHNFLLLIIKIVLIALVGAFIGIITVNKSKKIKVK